MNRLMFASLPLILLLTTFSMPVTLFSATPTQEKTETQAAWEPLQLPPAVTLATVKDLAVHPHDAAVLYLATEQGLYKSPNAGTTWARVDGLGDSYIFEVTLAESDPQRLYVRSWNGYRSDDGGASWQEFAMPTPICGFEVAPSQADRLYARQCGESDLPPVVYSNDGGQSWISPATALDRQFHKLVVAPDQPDTIVATTFEETWRSTDAGTTWQQAAIGVRYAGVPLFDRHSPPTLYLAHWAGLLRSEDRGVTWEDSDSAREFSTLIAVPGEAKKVAGGNLTDTWQLQIDSTSWQAAQWSAPEQLQQLWNSAHDPNILYAQSAQGLWRLDNRPMPNFVPAATIYLPLVQMDLSTTAAASPATTAADISASAAVHGAATDKTQRTPNEEAVLRVNHFRALAGVAPLQGHSALVAAAQNHVQYQIDNHGDPSAWEHGAHGQVEGKPSFTGQWPSDRIKAANYPWWGGAEVMHGLGDVLPSIDGWVDTVYHRFAILDPQNHYIGYAHHAGSPRSVDVMDFGGGPMASGLWISATPFPLAYPANGQNGVPISWNGAEAPSPLPPGASGPVGYPFTLQPVGGQLTIQTATLQTEAGALVPTHPNPPGCVTGRCLALIAIAPLQPQTTYVVNATGTVGDVPFNGEWRFTTGNERRAVTSAGAVASGTQP